MAPTTGRVTHTGKDNDTGETNLCTGNGVWVVRCHSV